MKIAKMLAILTTLFVAGCDRGEYGKADGQVLCNGAHEAFYVLPRIGQLSAVQRKPNFDRLCK